HPVETLSGGGSLGATAASSPLAMSADGRTLWVVNPDADTFTVVDLSDPTAPVTGSTIVVGGEPWAVAVTPSGTVISMNRRDGSLSFVTSEPTPGDHAPMVDTLFVGPEPGGLVLSATGE